MIHARQPQHVMALHTLVAGNNILQGGIPCMSQVQLSGYIGWRYYDAEGVLALISCCKIAVIDPAFVVVHLNVKMIIFRI